MKEFEGVFNPKPQILHEAEQRREYKHIGQIRLRPGMKLFQFDTQTMELSETKVISQVNITLKNGPVRLRRANFDPKCIYIPALNKKNAMRKLEQMIKQ